MKIYFFSYKDGGRFNVYEAKSEEHAWELLTKDCPEHQVLGIGITDIRDPASEILDIDC